MRAAAPGAALLPPTALQMILSGSSSSRCIAGTNKRLAVCRSWRAGAPLPSDYELLSLLFPGDNLDAEELSSATHWLARHGSTVKALLVYGVEARAAVVSALQSAAVPLAAAVPSAPALRQQLQLTRLEVVDLAAVVPLLQYMPHLQHLGAHFSCEDILASTNPPTGGTAAAAAAVPAPAPSPLQHHTQLTRLHLALSPDSSAGQPAGAQYDCSRLVTLMPQQLQRLKLDAGHTQCSCSALAAHTDLQSLELWHLMPLELQQLAGLPQMQQLTIVGEKIRLDCRQLSPLSAVQRLLLRGAWFEHVTALSSIESLQQLTLRGRRQYEMSDLLPLRHVLVESTAPREFTADLGQLSQLKALRWWHGPWFGHQLQLPAGLTRFICRPYRGTGLPGPWLHCSSCHPSSPAGKREGRSTPGRSSPSAADPAHGTGAGVLSTCSSSSSR